MAEAWARPERRQLTRRDPSVGLRARYTTELLELLWLLEGTIERDSEQAALLDQIRGGPQIFFRDQL
jgi:hypothetical protein